MSRDKQFIGCFVVIFFLCFFIGTVIESGDTRSVFANEKTEGTPDFLKLNMTLNIQKEAIEDFAEEHGWEKTREVTRAATGFVYEEDGFPVGTQIRGTLWTPTALWVDIMSEADLFLKPKEEAIEEYKRYEKSIFEKGVIHFTVNVAAMDKEEISIDNLDFVLEDDRSNRLRAEESAKVSSRGIVSRSALGFTVYRNTIDIDFIPPRYEYSEWIEAESLALYMIYRHPRRRIELKWEFDQPYSLEEQIDQYMQKYLKSTKVEGFLNKTLETLIKNNEELKILEIPSLTSQELVIRDDFFTVTVDSDDRTFTLFVQVLSLRQDTQHIFVQLNEISRPWSLFTFWDEEKQDLQVIRSDYTPTSRYPYFTIKPILLEEELYGIIYDSSFRMTMSYAVLIYTEDNGYQKVFSADSSWGGYSIDEDQGRIIHREHPPWDDSFPFKSAGYSTVDLRATLRFKEYTYEWDKDLLTFIKTDEEEIMHEVAVVNHFLKELLKENIATALELVKEDSPLWKIVKQGGAANILWLFELVNSDVYIVNIRDIELSAFELPRTDWMRKADYVNTDRPILAMVIAKPGVSRESDLNDILAVVIFELTYKQPWKIFDIHYCELDIGHITEEEASRLIWNLREVKDLQTQIKKMGGGAVRTIISERTDSEGSEYYHIQLFEDQEEHITTLDFYKVMKGTGEIYKMDRVTGVWVKLYLEDENSGG